MVSFVLLISTTRASPPQTVRLKHKLTDATKVEDGEERTVPKP